VQILAEMAEAANPPPPEDNSESMWVIDSNPEWMNEGFDNPTYNSSAQSPFYDPVSSPNYGVFGSSITFELPFDLPATARATEIAETLTIVHGRSREFDDSAQYMFIDDPSLSE
jgi:hypothetical protein